MGVEPEEDFVTNNMISVHLSFVPFRSIILVHKHGRRRNHVSYISLRVLEVLNNKYLEAAKPIVIITTAQRWSQSWPSQRHTTLVPHDGFDSAGSGALLWPR